MYLKGEDVTEGLKDWIKTELKEGPRQGYDMGKFFFTVSVGTIGAIATIEKLNAVSKLDFPMFISLFILFVSIIISLNMVRPGAIRIDGDTDIYEEYVKCMNRIISHGLYWF